MRSGTSHPATTAAPPAAAATSLHDADRAELAALVEYAVPIYPRQMIQGKERWILRALRRGLEVQLNDALRARHLERAARLERTVRMIDRELSEQESALAAAEA